jgi:P27 family predicted phage terminase small subunit
MEVLFMAGRNKEPIALVQAKGKKHLTKAEIEQRKAEELNVPSDSIEAPSYLIKSQKAEFDRIAKILIDLEIMTNLDCDALAGYIVARDCWVRAGKMIRSKEVRDNPTALERWMKAEDRYRKQMRSAAHDLGLTITSRGKIVAPVKETPPPPENKFAVFAGGGGS